MSHPLTVKLNNKVCVSRVTHIYKACYILKTTGITKVENTAAMWILKTRECHQIPISVMQSVINDVESLYAVGLGEQKDRIIEILDQEGASQELKDKVEVEITRGPLAHLFQNICTEAKQMSYFKQHFQLVVS